MNKYLIAGLGNYGPEYHLTRHNIGFIILDELVKKFESEFELKKLAFHTTIKYKGNIIECIKPTTYMNLSGKAIRYYLLKQNIQIENLLVVVDDISLPFGKIRYRKKGSDAGHNGLKNIQELVSTTAYPRLKWGIGNNFNKGSQVKYVLSPFSDEELNEISLKIEDTIESILSFCRHGITNTMNNYNK